MSKRFTFEQQQEQEQDRRDAEREWVYYEAWKDRVLQICQYPDIPEMSLMWLYKMEPDPITASTAVLAVQLATNIKETLDEQAQAQAEEDRAAERPGSPSADPET